MIPTVKVACPVTEDNPHGFYIVNAEEVTDGMKVVNDDPSDFGSMKVAELQDFLAAAGIDIPEGAKKADLIALCQAVG